jgi:hypothetical protein
LPSAAIERKLGAVICVQHRNDLFGEPLQVIAGGEELCSQRLDLGEAGEDDQVDTTSGGVRVGRPTYPAKRAEKLIGNRLSNFLQPDRVGTVSGRDLVKVRTLGRKLEGQGVVPANHVGIVRKKIVNDGGWRRPGVSCPVTGHLSN